MKIWILALFVSLTAFADINTTRLIGAWKSDCTQTQINGKQGYMIESYVFQSETRFQNIKQWYKDDACKEVSETLTQNGAYTVGNENLNNGFNPAGTYEVTYETRIGKDFGLLWVNEDYTKLRVSRGIGKIQNTMLGLFQYTKQ